LAGAMGGGKIQFCPFHNPAIPREILDLTFHEVGDLWESTPVGT
jgi:hypothetical protein